MPLTNHRPTESRFDRRNKIRILVRIAEALPRESIGLVTECQLRAILEKIVEDM